MEEKTKKKILDDFATAMIAFEMTCPAFDKAERRPEFILGYWSNKLDSLYEIRTKTVA